MQLVETGKVDPRRVALSAAGQAAVATAAETGRLAAERTQTYHKTVNRRLVKEDFGDDNSKRQQVMDYVEEANKVPGDTVKKQEAR